MHRYLWVEGHQNICLSWSKRLIWWPVKEPQEGLKPLDEPLQIVRPPVVRDLQGNNFRFRQMPTKKIIRKNLDEWIDERIGVPEMPEIGKDQTALGSLCGDGSCHGHTLIGGSKSAKQ